MPAWLGEPAVQRLLAALAKAGIEARFVGGCVRDALLRGEETGDLDLATPARPDAVMAALAAAKIKALPTGVAHGTVTAVVKSPGPPRTFEITTLRRDVETDGRHAVVAFGADWQEDAARRDFTINAIYLSADGTIFDPVGGQTDLAARRVRFVGDPATRIAEDVLRILRYYRFEARFGAGEGDALARAACGAAAKKLPTLSAERVSRELLRHIAGPDPVRVLTMMREDSVLAAILPEATRLDRLAAIVRPWPGIISPEPDVMLRLAMLVDVDRAGAAALGERLRLPAKDRKRLAALAKPWPFDPDADAKAQRLALYRIGRDTFLGIVMLLIAERRLPAEKAREMFALAGRWQPPVFPLGGDDVTALGIAPGPKIGRLLAAVRRWWEEGDFTADRAACVARLKELVERD
jgi:poly(A) polymerase